MIPTANGRRRLERRPNQSRTMKPVLEGLEDRKLLYATSGAQWPYATRVTYSFMPDGTSIGGTPSNLYQSMNAKGFSDATWQLQFQKAAAVWQSMANINIAQIGDDGTPLGNSGFAQGDPRFGDIRIGGYSANDWGMLAQAFDPPPHNGGTVAGDILLNTDQAFRVSGRAYDLESVAIHEIGHSLGMSHSEIASADMYRWYNYTKQDATPDDAAGLQSLYGAIPPDTIPNSNPPNATNLTPFLVNGQVTVGGGRISDPYQDIDYYSITVPANTNGTMYAVMQAGNLSSLSPRIVVFDQNQKFLGYSTQPYSYGGNAVAVIPNVTPGQVVYLRCQAASADPSGVGAYGIMLNFTGQPMSPVPPPWTVVPEMPNQGGGAAPELTAGSHGDSASINALFGGHGHGNGDGHGHSLGNAIADGNAIDLAHLIQIGSLSGMGDSLRIQPVGHSNAPVPRSAAAHYQIGSPRGMGAAPTIQPVASFSAPVSVPDPAHHGRTVHHATLGRGRVHAQPRHGLSHRHLPKGPSMTR